MPCVVALERSRPFSRLTCRLCQLPDARAAILSELGVLSAACQYLDPVGSGRVS